MDETLHPALLPAGLGDLLPPDARIEAHAVERLLGALERHGYERVMPPLVEFEASLLGGFGAAMAQETFRLMDPISHRMVGLRADMTLQVARIATTRLTKSPRPLRLCYAGQVLRVQGTELRPERQFTQVGAELIGTDLPEADAELVILAAESLTGLGVEGLSVDLTLPTLVPLVLDALGIPAGTAQQLRQALDHKDAAGIASAGGAAASVLAQLMAAAGPADRSLARIAGLALPAAARAEVEKLAGILALIRAALPGLTLTIDPVENRGFEYHTGLSFSLFARGIRGELGRGGRYRAGAGDGTAVQAPPIEEPATGFTLYTNTVIQAVPPGASPRRVYVPHGAGRAEAARLREADWVTVAGLAPGDARAEARRLGCSHVLDGDEPVAV